jgi:ornithine cyclodeaminase
LEILDANDVNELVSVRECYVVMRSALMAYSSGNAVNPLRQVMSLPSGAGLLGMMPAAAEDAGIAGFKGIMVNPGNHARGKDSHRGIVYVADLGDGTPLAVVDASAVTAIRTAAVSAVATDLLAREGATRLALVGTGIQASSHLRALLEVRPFSRVTVCSRDPAHAQRFVEQHTAHTAAELHATRSVQAAVADAHVICTVTSSSEPVLASHWVTDGCHINAVGACRPNARELDSALVARAELFVDSVESALNEAGDFIIPKDEGLIDRTHIRAEIGQLLLGAGKGRGSPRSVTVFKALGLAVEDLMLAHWACRKRVSPSSPTLPA